MPRLLAAHLLGFFSLAAVALALLPAAPLLPSASTATPGPTIQPTPHPGLAEAETLRASGDYGAAAERYRALTQQAQPSLAQLAWLGLGETLLAARDQPGAGAALERASAPGGADQVRGRALVRLALLRRDRGDCRAALALLAAAEPLLPLGPYLPLQRAACYAELDEPAQALAEAQLALPQATTRAGRAAALERLARASLALEQREEAARWYAELLPVAATEAERARIRYQLGQVARALGREAEAVDHFRGLVVEQPAQPWATRALEALQEMGRQGVVSYAQAGQVYFSQGLYAQARAAFAASLELEPAGPEAAQARYFSALARLRQGDEQGAAEALLALADEAPASELVPAALLRGGRILESLDLLGRAAQAFERLATASPDSPIGAEARFRQGFVHWLEGKRMAAEAVWAALADAGRAPAPWRAQASLWLGLARAQAGDQAASQERWRQAASLDPQGYAGLRAASRLDEVGGWRLDPTSNLQPSTSNPAEVEAQPAYRLATALLAAGLEAEAGRELAALADDLDRSPERLAALGVLLAQPATQHLSLAYARRAASALGGSPGALPLPLQRLLYPLPYEALARAQGERFGVDPLLLAALIRQESSFNPGARSPVGALGLAQVMPQTGQLIAQALGVVGFTPDRLLQPRVSLEFGAWYLAGRLERYQGQLLPALAAYNAGDGAVNAWLTQYGPDPDTFAERIPYPETYRFVRIVYENYHHYQRLYEPPVVRGQ
ncbi:MAG: lytic transglycosylase domain-containing protein [Chloroflexi bacterium]|nr:lytic transglycosylase domain-containing protein [Chloroflexota bacterium]